MASFKVDRVNEIIKEELATLIKGMKDPRMSEAVVSVTRVKTTPDMKYTKVAVSIYSDKYSKSEVLAILNKAKGFMRKHLAEVLTTRFAPEIVFELDETLDYAMHIEEVLKKINSNGKH